MPDYSRDFNGPVVALILDVGLRLSNPHSGHRGLKTKAEVGLEIAHLMSRRDVARHDDQPLQFLGLLRPRRDLSCPPYREADNAEAVRIGRLAEREGRLPNSGRCYSERNLAFFVERKNGMRKNTSTDHRGGGLAAEAGQFVIGNDLAVNRLGFGAMRITGKGIWGPPPDRAEAVRVLRRALELGVNFIDTADSYGPGVSEEIIAEALHPYPEGLVIATKGGFDRPGPDRWVENGRPEHLKSACEGSLRRLRLGQIDLYQLHRIDPKVPAEDQLGALKDLQAQGKIKHIGLSEVSVIQIQHAQKIVPIVSVQNRYSLADRGSEDVLEYCETHKIGFIPWFPLAAGQLSGPGSSISRVAAQSKATPSQVALAWLLERSPVMLPIPGTSSVKHLEENVEAAGLKMDETAMRELSRTASAG
jgi:pyridoxine 4-dehydrogenase